MYAFKYLINNRKLFIRKLKINCFDFIMTSGQIFYIKSVAIINIFFTNRIINLEDIIYIFDYNANLIVLEQLCKNNIIFEDNNNNMMLIQKKQKIA